ncbi:MAG TPA: hypothetical protein VF278_18840, partial [Pirellulales bacterium]
SLTTWEGRPTRSFLFFLAAAGKVASLQRGILECGDSSPLSAVAERPFPLSRSDLFPCRGATLVGNAHPTGAVELFAGGQRPVASGG